MLFYFPHSSLPNHKTHKGTTPSLKIGRNSFKRWLFSPIRTLRYKYIETYDESEPTQLVFRELYDLDTDPIEMDNLAKEPGSAELIQQMQVNLQQAKQRYR